MWMKPVYAGMDEKKNTVCVDGVVYMHSAYTGTLTRAYVRFHFAYHLKFARSRFSMVVCM